MRNDLTIYDRAADRWWSDELRWVRTLKNRPPPTRLGWFDRFIDWQKKDVLDLGCAGGCMAEAMAARGANVIGIDPAAEAIAAARSYARADGLRTGNDIGVGEELPYGNGTFDAVICVDVLWSMSGISDEFWPRLPACCAPAEYFFRHHQPQPDGPLGHDYSRRRSAGAATIWYL